MDTSRLTVVDLFSGAGGFSFAANNMGMDVLAAIEFDKKSCDTYKSNLIERMGNGARLYHSDILELCPTQVLKDIKLEIKALDLLIGGTAMPRFFFASNKRSRG